MYTDCNRIKFCVSFLIQIRVSLATTIKDYVETPSFFLLLLLFLLFLLLISVLPLAKVTRIELIKKNGFLFIYIIVKRQCKRIILWGGFIIFIKRLFFTQTQRTILRWVIKKSFGSRLHLYMTRHMMLDTFYP